VLLKSKQLKALRRYKRLLRKVALKKTPRSERRRVLQTGGFIGAILKRSYQNLALYSILLFADWQTKMKIAKFMELVDKKMLEYKPMVKHFQSKQDLTWKRPTKESITSSFIELIKSTIDDPVVSAYIKARRYRQHLDRFLHTKRKLDEEPTIDELFDIKPYEAKGKKKKMKTVVITKVKRTSK
jgi:hypothetical protein